MTRRLAARTVASWPYLAAAAWVVGSIVLFERTGIDVRLPCLIESIFGVACPGCGLTGAVQALLHGDPSAAWASNPLLFVILPAGLWYWLRGPTPIVAVHRSSA
jgi:hypothetical protein